MKTAFTRKEADKAYQYIVSKGATDARIEHPTPHKYRVTGKLGERKIYMTSIACLFRLQDELDPA